MKKINVGYIVLMSLTTCLLLTVGTLTYQKRNPDKTVFGLDLNGFNEKVDALFTFQKEEKVEYVSTNLSHHFRTENEEVPALFDGTVLCNEGEVFCVYYENGITAYYSNLLHTSFQKGDVFEKRDTLATYQTSFKVIFLKENEEISYSSLIA